PGVGTFTWAFATGECGQENWGGIPGAKLASANVAAWAQARRAYVISTGGAAGSFTCASDAAFFSFIDRYASAQLVGIDFDIEAGQSADSIAALVARVKAAQAHPKYGRLRYSFTLATLGGDSPQSLGDKGVTVMAALKAAGLGGYFVNLMTMDYGSTKPVNCVVKNGQCDMGASAIQAAVNLNRFYGVPFDHIELTPMIGGNDTPDETFTLDDVSTVTSFARQKGLAGLHHWSLDRDMDCTATFASPTCNSYGRAGTLGFTKRFQAGL
ncbi:MAG TPA: glycosyl hydrolase, partial [Myxococcota bacterium]|nr:glycosyl hydrolase [Myxococcota bacterium]